MRSGEDAGNWSQGDLHSECENVCLRIKGKIRFSCTCVTWWVCPLDLSCWILPGTVAGRNANFVNGSLHSSVYFRTTYETSVLSMIQRQSRFDHVGFTMVRHLKCSFPDRPCVLALDPSQRVTHPA